MIFSFHLYQIVVATISVVMIYQGLRQYVRREKSQTFLKLFVRLVVWGGMAAITLFPPITNTVAKIIGLQGNVNAAILTGFLLVFLLIFKLLSSIERLEKQLSDLTRKDAIKEIKDNVLQ